MSPQTVILSNPCPHISFLVLYKQKEFSKFLFLLKENQIGSRIITKMREIKAKVWDTQNKKWIEEFLIDKYGEIWVWPTGEETPIPQMGTWLIAVEYTGLKDKNGVEIYEGDILKKDFGIKNILLEVRIPECYDSDSEYSIYLPEDWEIIGNIYENTELLK